MFNFGHLVDRIIHCSMKLTMVGDHFFYVSSRVHNLLFDSTILLKSSLDGSCTNYMNDLWFMRKPGMAQKIFTLFWFLSLCHFCQFSVCLHWFYMILVGWMNDLNHGDKKIVQIWVWWRWRRQWGHV